MHSQAASCQLPAASCQWREGGVELAAGNQALLGTGNRVPRL